LRIQNVRPNRGFGGGESGGIGGESGGIGGESVSFMREDF
jgi:hypothetical protein